MKQQLIKEILRSKLLMKYDASKTYSDNLNEQFPDSRYETEYNRMIKKQGEEDRKKREEEEKKNAYPNYCLYSDKTHDYPDACGAILDNGIFLLKAAVGTRQEQVDVSLFCNYGMPTPRTAQGGVSSLLLPTGKNRMSGMTINFCDEGNWEDMTKRIWERFGPNSKRKLYQTESDFTALYQNIATIFPKDTVSSFYYDKNEEWVSMFTLTNDPGGGAYGHFVDPIQNPWIFTGYEKKVGGKLTGEYYPYVTCVDTRTARQKFTDDWGWLIQWGGMIVTIIAGFFTAGAGWVLFAEILAEMSIATFIAWREIEKGNNIEAAISILTGMAPMLKSFQGFRGLSQKTADEISDLLKKPKYNGFKTADDYAKFYDDLSEPAKKEWNIIARQDDLARESLMFQTGTDFAANGEKIFFEQAQAWFKANPDKKWKIDFFRRLWVREAGTNVGIIALGFLTQAMWGDVLDSKYKEDLNGLMLNVPENAQLEFVQNLAMIDPKYASVFAERVCKLEEEYNRDIQKQVEIFQEMAKRAGKSADKINADYVKWLNTQKAMKKAMSEFGLQYQDASEDPVKITDFMADPNQLKKDGYVLLSYDDDWSQYPSENVVWTQDGLWYKKPDESELKLKPIGKDDMPIRQELNIEPSKVDIKIPQEPIKIEPNVNVEPNKNDEKPTGKKRKSKNWKTPEYF